ncbi:MAG: Smr/MutS family protein [Gemmatimonadetes bacterium]|nr:Smr/MutS family protein [Gemmatimonadota bacterium]
MSPRRGRSLGPVLAALDDVRFGAGNILNLRDAMPTAADAVARADAWLRERQVARAGDVLIVTGRGNGSADGVPVVRNAVARLCAQLKRRGVVASVRDHSPGAFEVTLAPMSRLLEAPARARHPAAPRAAAPEALAGLSPGTRHALRSLAERSLDDLGVPGGDVTQVEDEMRRLFARLAPSAPTDAALLRAIEAAREALDDR